MAVGIALSGMGDFGTDWGLRAQFNTKSNWLLSAGWNNVDATVLSVGGPMAVKGDLWQLDLSYIVWGAKPVKDAKTPIEGLNWYYGAGIGLRNIDADWSLFGLTNDAKKLAGAGHAVVGARWSQYFADLRY